MIQDFVYIPLIVLVALQFPRLILSREEERYAPMLQKLILFHFLLGVAFYFTTRNGGGDAWGYWTAGKRMTGALFWAALQEGEGTMFMQAVNYIPSGILGMGFLANTMFFSMLGAVGMVLFFAVAVRTIPYNRMLFGYALFPLIFFLPQLHFWSSGVGKDTVLFLCIAVFAYGLMDPLKRLPMIVFALIPALAIRPHIVLFLFVSFGLAYVLGGRIPVWQRTLLSLVMLGAGLAILPSVLEFAKIEEASVESFDEFAGKKADVLSRAHTGSSVDVSSYPFPLKVFTFWFRPMFFDARNINGLVASAENLLLVSLFVMILRRKPYRALKAAPFVIKGLVLFAVVGTLAFAPTLGNLGIMIRMRNMFLPGFLIYLMWVFSYEQQRLRPMRQVRRPAPAQRKTRKTNRD